MSGGSLDYPDGKIQMVADAILRTVEMPQPTERWNGPLPTHAEHRPDLRRKLAAHLMMLAEVLHDLEWYDSGDSGPEKWIAGAERLFGKMPDPCRECLRPYGHQHVLPCPNCADYEEKK